MHISACTADCTEENEIKCKKLKFDSILFKPISFLRLKRLVDKNLCWYVKIVYIMDIFKFCNFSKFMLFYNNLNIN